MGEFFQFCWWHFRRHGGKGSSEHCKEQPSPGLSLFFFYSQSGVHDVIGIRQWAREVGWEGKNWWHIKLGHQNMTTLESINATWQLTHGHANGSIWNGLFIVPQADERGRVSSSYFVSREKLNFLAHKYLFKLELWFTFLPSVKICLQFLSQALLFAYWRISCTILWSPPLSFYATVYWFIMFAKYKNTFHIKILYIFFRSQIFALFSFPFELELDWFDWWPAY